MSVYDAARDEQSTAIRALLARPLLRRQLEPDVFRAVAVHFRELRDWFQQNLGWRLEVDRPAGIVRLHKRTSLPDARRGFQRPGGSQRSFDAMRYQILALVCAQLLRRPHVTLGDLADALESVTSNDPQLRRFDPTRHAHRVAFVDVLVWLREMGALDTTVGNLEDFTHAERKDAVLRADTTVLPLLLSSDTPPSRIDQEVRGRGTEGWLDALCGERSHGAAVDPEGVERSHRARWARWEALRRLLDEPAVDVDTLPTTVREYLQSPAGRQKVLREIATAGLRCERHADLWMALDPSGESNDEAALFGSRPSVQRQVAAILLSSLAPVGEDGERRLIPRSVAALQATLQAYLERNRKWARGARQSGAAAMCAEALELLERFGLVHRAGSEVHPRPAAGRYLVTVDEGGREKGAGP